MKTIAIISQKGGTGKTTIAVHLAVAAEQQGKSTVIVDLDPQASATSWKDLRRADTPAVVSAQAARLPQVLKTAEAHGADLAILDTAPHSETTALAAARQADLILIPCRPAILDLKAISLTVDLVKLAGKQAYVVFNAVPPRGSLVEEAIAAIQTYGVPVLPATLAHRSVFMHALTGGLVAQEFEPKGKAAVEILQVYRYTCKHVRL
ncbi:MAG: ParA family protein [Bryobacterales bacterium]|nr:ParA family protein [Bryobacterales bacterium]